MLFIRAVIFSSILLFPFIAPAQWTDNQSAEFVIGQPNFTTNAQDVSDIAYTRPHGVAIDVTNGKVYISDQNANRVLRYDYPITADEPAADLVFGQPDFTSDTANNGGIDADTLNFPVSLSVDSTGRLWVNDATNNRILWFNAAHSILTNMPSADGVLGQANFTSNLANRGGSAAANTLSTAIGLEVHPTNGTLWVADRDNARVLRYDNAASKANGADADGVLGQANFTSTAAGTTDSTFDFPYTMTTDGTTLWVVDVGNNRVLRFDNAESKANGAAADGVLGQAIFTTDASGLTDSTFNFPHDVAVDPQGRLYVPDFLNHRLLIFNNAASKANGAAADNVLGQTIFTSDAADLNQQGLWAPGSVDIDATNGKLLVAGMNSYRVLVFSASSPLPVELDHFSVE